MGHSAVRMLMAFALAGTVIEDWWCCSVGRVVERRSGVASESASVPPHRVGSKSMPWNCVGLARDDDDVDAGSVPTGIGVGEDNGIRASDQLYGHDIRYGVIPVVAIEGELYRSLTVDRDIDSAGTVGHVVDFKLIRSGCRGSDIVEGNGVGRACTEASDIGSAGCASTVIEARSTGQLRAFGLIGLECWWGFAAVTRDHNPVEVGPIAGWIPECNGVLSGI